jgi:hypothetical protein
MYHESCPERSTASGGADSISYLVNSFDPRARQDGGPGF